MKRVPFPQQEHTQSRYHDRYLRTAGVTITETRSDVILTVLKRNGAPAPFELALPKESDTLLTIADALAQIATKNQQPQPPIK